MSELLSCPFCGGEQTIRKHGGKVYLASTNHKRGCIMRELLPFVAFSTEAEAAEAWNTRYHSAYEETVIKAWKEIKAWNTSQQLRAFDTVETAQLVAELEQELEDARAEIRRLEAQGEYMCRQIAKAKEALR